MLDDETLQAIQRAVEVLEDAYDCAQSEPTTHADMAREVAMMRLSRAIALCSGLL